MQIIVKLKGEQELVLPIQYNHILQGFVYSAISPELAEFLHERGYQFANRRFKLFTFSRLRGKYKLSQEKNQIIFSDKVELVISSPVDEFCQSLANGVLTKGYFKIGNNQVEVESISVQKKIISQAKMVFKTLSPVVVYKTLLKPEGGKYTCYLQPGEPEYNKLLTNNLQKKYSAFTGKEAPIEEVEVRKIGHLHLNVLKYKDTVIKGYSGRLELTGPVELLQMGLDAGIGSKNSQGFGCGYI